MTPWQFPDDPDRLARVANAQAALDDTWPARLARTLLEGFKAPGDAIQGKTAVPIGLRREDFTDIPPPSAGPNYPDAGAPQFTATPDTAQPIDATIAKTTDIAGALMSGGSLGAVKGAAGIFGGRLAKTADHAALKRAEEMATAGKRPKDIWDATGWFQGADKQWRFEIPDNQSAWRTAKPGEPDAQFAEHSFSHPQLYEAYPQARSTIVKPYRVDDPFGTGVGSNVRGAYSHDTRTVALNPATRTPEAQSTFLHELQHRIQREEGFAVGGSDATPEVRNFASDLVGREQARNQARADELLRARDSYVAQRIAAGEPEADTTLIAARYWRENPELYGEWRGLFDKDFRGIERAARHDAYRRLAGETEARNVQERAHMTPEDRAATPPWLTQEFPDSRQIVRFADDPNRAALINALMARGYGGPSAGHSDALARALAAR